MKTSKRNNFRLSDLKIAFLLVTAFMFCTSNLFSQIIPSKKGTDTIKISQTLLFNKMRFDTVSIDIKEAILKEMEEYAISSGTIFLSGTGFYQPLMLNVSGKFGLSSPYHNQIVAGTRLTLDKCVLKSKTGKTMMLTKSFFFR